MDLDSSAGSFAVRDSKADKRLHLLRNPPILENIQTDKEMEKAQDQNKSVCFLASPAPDDATQQRMISGERLGDDSMKGDCHMSVTAFTKPLASFTTAPPPLLFPFLSLIFKSALHCSEAT